MISVLLTLLKIIGIVLLSLLGVFLVLLLIVMKVKNSCLKSQPPVNEVHPESWTNIVQL